MTLRVLLYALCGEGFGPFGGAHLPEGRPGDLPLRPPRHQWWFWDTPAVHKRGLGIDWARCCTDRFKKAVLPFRPAEDPVRADKELLRLRTVLTKHRTALYSAFTYFAVAGATAPTAFGALGAPCGAGPS